MKYYLFKILQVYFGILRNMSLNEIQDADIDSKGRFKYILIKLVEKSTKTEKLKVRGKF